MNLRAARTFSGTRRRRQSGFTMAEIAIALGVIAVALIAILGVLPSGLQVQRDNREETIINQDARLLLQALKTAGREDLPASDLGSFVVITNGVPVNGIPTDVLLQFLCDPFIAHTNVLAAISGGIASRGSDLGFRYQLVSEVNSPLTRTLFGNAGDFVLPDADVSLTNQLFDVRLRFSWPVLPNGQLASEANRYVVRCLLSGWFTNGVIYAQEYRQPKPPTP